MINVKDTISFKTLREKGPTSIEIEKDEVVQLVSRGSEIKIILTQEYFLELINSHNAIKANVFDKKTEEINVLDKIKQLESRFAKIADIANEDDDGGVNNLV